MVIRGEQAMGTVGTVRHYLMVTCVVSAGGDDNPELALRGTQYPLN